MNDGQWAISRPLDDGNVNRASEVFYARDSIFVEIDKINPM